MPFSEMNHPAYSEPYGSGRGFAASAAPAASEEEEETLQQKVPASPAASAGDETRHWQRLGRFEHGLGLRGFYEGRPELSGATSNLKPFDMSRPTVTRMLGPMGRPVGVRQAKWAGNKVKGRVQSGWKGAKGGYEEVMATPPQPQGAKPPGTQFAGFAGVPSWLNQRSGGAPMTGVSMYPQQPRPTFSPGSVDNSGNMPWSRSKDVTPGKTGGGWSFT